MAEQDFINCGIGGMLKVTVEDGVIKRMRPLSLTEEDGGQMDDRSQGQEIHRPAQDPHRHFRHRRKDAGLFRKPHQVPHEAEALRP